MYLTAICRQQSKSNPQFPSSVADCGEKKVQNGGGIKSDLWGERKETPEWVKDTECTETWWSTFPCRIYTHSSRISDKLTGSREGMVKNVLTGRCLFFKDEVLIHQGIDVFISMTKTANHDWLPTQNETLNWDHRRLSGSFCTYKIKTIKDGEESTFNLSQYLGWWWI